MSMASAVKAAQDAAAASADHPQASDDVIMLSADPILILNSQDQSALESADVRTEVAMSGPHNQQVHSAPDSLVKYVVMASLPSPRMDMFHVRDVQHFASSFKTSGASFDFKRFTDTKDQRYWVILNDAEFKLYQQHHVLQVPRVKESSHQLNWKLYQSLQDSIYHMIYLTVARCVRHGSPASSVISSAQHNSTRSSGIMLEGHLQHFEVEDLNGIKSLNLKQQAPGHLRLSSFMDEIQITRSFTPLLGSSGRSK